jgi:hypothetical protein
VQLQLDRRATRVGEWQTARVPDGSALLRVSATIRYEVITRSRGGHEHVYRYASDAPLTEGDLITLRGNRWIIDSVEDQGGGQPRTTAEPACYRLVLRYEDGSEEIGAFRRFGAHEIGLGHAFTTLLEGKPVSWQVTEERVARDGRGRPFIEFVAERDYGEVSGELPDHELEHAGDNSGVPDAAAALIAQAGEAGLRSELVALDPGTVPDWEEAERYISSLILEEFEDDLLELCGINLDREPRETWLAKAQQRLQQDLELFRADVEGDHDEIEEWDSRSARIFASVGSWEDEAAPDKGHGWMSRLVDVSALAAAGFRRVRKVEL